MSVAAKKLVGKVALVTGSTDGIGRHTATNLARLGAKVLLHGRSMSRLEDTRDDILRSAPGSSLELYNFDLSSLRDLKTGGRCD